MPLPLQCRGRGQIFKSQMRDSGEIQMRKPTQGDTKAAARRLIEWTGDDPDREELIDTPSRVARSYRELFVGYGDDPRDSV
jgi:GTP cyclohydrolase I